MYSKGSKEVADALELNIIARFGVPDELRMDRGLEFAGHVVTLCKNKILLSRTPNV